MSEITDYYQRFSINNHHLTGMDYLRSETKTHFDQYVADLCAPLARAGAYLTELAIHGNIDESHRFYQERSFAGRLLNVPKIRTMHEVSPGEPMDIDRYSRRILNRRALITRIIGLDELPQWELVGSGEMSIVGPRPMLQECIDNTSVMAQKGGVSETAIDEWREFINTVRPGIFGLSQALRHRRSFQEYSPHGSASTVHADLAYKTKASVAEDIKVTTNSIVITVAEGLKASPRSRVA